MYDIIGDIHGHATPLKKFLKKIGYEYNGKSYSHQERTAVFVGDFIDRGPEIRETLKIVRDMTEQGKAIAVMGNHEYNALCYHTEISEGNYLRERSKKNDEQHEQTLEQFKNHENELKDYLDWFRTLPLYLDLGNLRVVHACWDDENISHIKEEKINFTKDSLIELHQNKKSKLYTSIDETLKGKEHEIPNRHSFKDKAGFKRSKNRFKWWIDPKGKTYDECYFEEVKELNGVLMKEEWTHNTSVYSHSEIPVFCGHYWLKDKKPNIQTRNVVCVDYSVAKDNILAAYRWNGEQTLSNDNFVFVDLKEKK